MIQYSERDEVAEWLRRWTANPMGSPRVSSNLILVDSFDVSCFGCLCGSRVTLCHVTGAK